MFKTAKKSKMIIGLSFALVLLLAIMPQLLPKANASNELLSTTENFDGAVSSVTVTYDSSTTSNINTKIENTLNVDALSTNLIGRTGVPMNITTETNFKKATLKFKIDTSTYNDNIENLYVFRMDGLDEDFYQIITQRNVDHTDNTITIETDLLGRFVIAHLGKYQDAINDGTAKRPDADIDDVYTDTDEDGIPDIFEINGLKLTNGITIYTDPNNPDTDGDGLCDGLEVDISNRYLGCGANQFTWNILFGNDSPMFARLGSDPTKKDTDGDKIPDGLSSSINNRLDPNPLFADIW